MHPQCNGNCRVILGWRAFVRGSSIPRQESPAGLGLLAFALIAGGSLGIGLPLALVIIWLARSRERSGCRLAALPQPNATFDIGQRVGFRLREDRPNIER